jgi:ethanolamine ammonia-lyase large subunit
LLGAAGCNFIMGAPGSDDITIRFDADVLAVLKSGGKGGQTRVNDAMRDWLKQHTPSNETTGVAVGS